MFEFHINYLLSIFKNYIKEIKVQDNYLKIKIKDFNKLFFLINFLKLHSFLRYKLLTDIACVDFINKNKRFELNYMLLSIDYNSRLIISVNFEEKNVISSLINIYSGSN
jgi:NADH:ubiquinone oxidoreductase subunit C